MKFILAFFLALATREGYGDSRLFYVSGGVGVVPLGCRLGIMPWLCPQGYTPGSGGSSGGGGGSGTVPADIAQQRTNAVSNGNSYRSRHNAPPLTEDPTLSAESQKYAEELCKTGQFKHSDPQGRYGENLAKLPSPATIAAANDAWYNTEKNVYCPAKGVNLAGGHFTQMVWKASTTVGYGSMVCSDGSTYVVARYTPPGNAGANWDPFVDC